MDLKSGISGPVIRKSTCSRVVKGTVSNTGAGVVNGSNISSVVIMDGNEGIGVVWNIPSTPVVVRSNRPNAFGVVGRSKFNSGFGV